MTATTTTALPCRSLGIHVPTVDLPADIEVSGVYFSLWDSASKEALALDAELREVARRAGYPSVGNGSARRLTADTWGAKAMKNDAALGWHKDCYGSPQRLFVWASQDPTWIRWGDGNGDWVEHQPEPYEIVVFDNHLCEHKGPQTVDGVRWFWRAYTNDPLDPPTVDLGHYQKTNLFTVMRP